MSDEERLERAKYLTLLTMVREMVDGQLALLIEPLQEIRQELANVNQSVSYMSNRLCNIGDHIEDKNISHLHVGIHNMTLRLEQLECSISELKARQP
jgi:hypothetical protein